MAWNENNEYVCDNPECNNTTRHLSKEFIKWRCGWFCSEECLNAYKEQVEKEESEMVA